MFLPSSVFAEAPDKPAGSLGDYGLRDAGHIEPNSGQFDPGIVAQATAKGVEINFRAASFDVITPAGEGNPGLGPPPGAGRPREAGPESCLFKGGFCLKTPKVNTTAYSFAGANQGATVSSQESRTTRVRHQVVCR